MSMPCVLLCGIKNRSVIGKYLLCYLNKKFHHLTKLHPLGHALTPPFIRVPPAPTPQYLCCDLSCATEPVAGCGIFGLPIVCKACYDGDGTPSYDDDPIDGSPTPTPTEEPVAAPTEEPVAAPTEEPAATPTPEPVMPVAPSTPEPVTAPTPEPVAAPQVRGLV